MKSPTPSRQRTLLRWFSTVGAVLALGLVFQLAVARGLTSGEQNEIPGAASSQRSVPQIECITPDGRVSQVPRAGDWPAAQDVPARLVNDAINCSLGEGETVFIISLNDLAPRDRVTFINENAAACGQLTIAVSNQRLPAASTAWTAVDGVIPFAHKRLFNLSMVGVEAQYVKLSFRVQRALAGLAVNF